MSGSTIDRLVAIAREAGLLRPRDLASHGIARIYLTLAVRRGCLVKVGRGLYSVAEAPISANASLMEVCKRAPRAVLCLLTALRFHEIGTQNPSDVWLAVRSKDRKPRIGSIRLHIVRFSERALREGVDEHRISGVTIRITNPVRTVIDCFRYRNKIGLDVAVEALRECCRMRLATAGELADCARANHVLGVMRPYLESLA
jgi:predicted transcriptional regulator of viral defense system